MTAVATTARPPAEARRTVTAVIHRARRRVALVRLALVAAVVVAVCLSIAIGTFAIPVLDVPAALLGMSDARTELVVNELRLPRTATGLLVGLAFGLSGSIFQSLARNPLASPDIIGITAGASFGAVFVLLVLGGSTMDASIGSFAGAMGVAVVTYTLAIGRNGVPAHRLILVGIGVAVTLGAGVDYILSRARTDDLRTVLQWLVGSLNGRGWDQAVPVAVTLLVLAPAALLLGRELRALQLGAATATAIGVRTGVVQTGLVVVGVGLAAVGTAAAGPVALVAFIAPPIARRLERSPGPAMVSSALVGAVLLVSADLVGRALWPFGALPVGVVTGLLGGPYLLVLLTRANRIDDVA